jgi:chaperonin GroES
MRATLALPMLLCALSVVDRGYAWVPSHQTSSSARPRTMFSHHHPTTALRQSSTSTSTSSSAPSQYTLDGQDIRGEITPLGNIVLVKVKETLTATTGGILLPDQAKERPTEGVVVCAGPGKIHPFTAVRIASPIKEGMSVLYGKFDGRPVNYNGEECQVIRDDDVLLTYQGLTMRLDNVNPVRDYVLIEVEKPTVDDLQTTSGVVVAAQVMKDKAVCEGRVVKVGEGRMASLGNVTPSPVQPGDYVKWKDYAGNEVKIEGKEYSLVKMVDLLATRTDETK